MKWREPWRESITQQASLAGSLRRLSRAFLVWYAVFAVLVVLYAIAGRILYNDVPARLVEASLYAAGMAVVLHLIWLLSPRKVESGPRGIVVTKANEMLTIPWQSIASFKISRPVLPGSLLLRLHFGETYGIVLPHDAHPIDVQRELTERTGAQV